MNSGITQKQAIFRFGKAYLSQYLTSIHGYDSFQDEALNLLTIYIIQVIKSLAVKVNKLVRLQGRTLPNSLHLLTVIEQDGIMNIEKLLAFIRRKGQMQIDTKSFEVLQRLAKQLFQNDIESVNNYPKETQHSNIRYIPSVYVADLTKQALPYRHPVDEAFPLPPQVTYQETKQKITKEKRNVEQLSAYTKRENKIALVGKKLDEQREKMKQNKGQQPNTQKIYGNNVKPQKKLKFDLINYI